MELGNNCYGKKLSKVNVINLIFGKLVSKKQTDFFFVNFHFIAVNWVQIHCG